MRLEVWCRSSRTTAITPTTAKNARPAVVRSHWRAWETGSVDRHLLGCGQVEAGDRAATSRRPSWLVSRTS